VRRRGRRSKRIPLGEILPWKGVEGHFHCHRWNRKRENMTPGQRRGSLTEGLGNLIPLSYQKLYLPLKVLYAH
jgi:hypothetical protein